jgi:hypothetical protein
MREWSEESGKMNGRKKEGMEEEGGKEELNLMLRCW